MKPTSGSLAASSLSESVHHRLNMYALAASAAGVGVLALARPAEAKIIYTPANQSIGPITYLDLNHDGITDFQFTTHHVSHQTHSCTSASGGLAVYGARPANKISGESVFASVLPAGAYIGPAGKFRGGKMVAVARYCPQGSTNGWYHRGGFWGGAAGGGIEHRYLGLKFGIKVKIHFGWARLNVIIVKNLAIEATLTGYAYETIPNKRIIAGKTRGEAEDAAEYDSRTSASLTNFIPDTPQAASLGVLALGAQGIPLWRRKQNEPVVQGN